MVCLCLHQKRRGPGGFTGYNCRYFIIGKLLPIKRVLREYLRQLHAIFYCGKNNASGSGNFTARELKMPPGILLIQKFDMPGNKAFNFFQRRYIGKRYDKPNGSLLVIALISSHPFFCCFSASDRRMK